MNEKKLRDGMRVAIYARVSTGRQVKNDLSIPDQLQQLRHHCVNQNWVLAKEFTEEGRSATTDKRPVFQKMIEEAESNDHPFDLVLVHSFSRAFRNMDDFICYTRNLRRAGVRMISITQEADEETLEGRMCRIMIGFADELYSAETSKHVKRTMRSNAERGFFNGSKPPFGYKTKETSLPAKGGKKKVLEIDEEERSIVEKIFDLYDHGINGRPLGIKLVASELNALQYTRRNGRWSVQEVQRVLSDRVYIGEFIWGGRGSHKQKPDCEIKVPVPAIIDKERFERLAVKRYERTRAQKAPLHTSPPRLLTGLCVCGCCGASMMVSTGKGGRYHYLKCKTRLTQHIRACNSPNLPLQAFEAQLIGQLIAEVLTPERVERILDDCRKRIPRVQGGDMKERAELERVVTTIGSKLSRLYTAIENGVVQEEETLRTRIDVLQHERQAANLRLKTLQTKILMPPSAITKTSVEAFTKKMREYLSQPESEHAKQFLRIFVDKIEVHADTATVSGSNLGMLGAVIQSKKNAAESEGAIVPSFIPNWWAPRDLNPEPKDYESSALTD